MQRKKILIVITVLLSVLVLAASTPALLRTVPSRYLASASAKLPTSLQQPFNQITMPQQEAAILPTVAVVADVGLLLATGVPPTETSLPPTFTPAPRVEVTSTPPPTITPMPPTPTTAPLPTSTPIPFPAAFRLEGIRHQFQEWNNCGPATLAMTLSYFGLRLNQNDTATILKPNPEDRNVSPHEMADYVNNHTDYQALFRVNGNEETLKRLLSNGIPVILEIGIEPPGEFQWMGWYGHYMLLVAYDDAAQTYWVYDSWLGTGGEPLSSADLNGRILTYEALQRDWPHFNRNYIALYTPEQAPLVADILGANMDDAAMWQQSLDQAVQDVQNDGENPFYWFNLGTSYNAIGNYELAAQAYDQARAIGLPWRMLWYQFGPYEAYYQVGRFEDVLLLADVTLDQRPYFEESFYYRGLAQAALSNQSAARADLEKATAFNPNFLPAIQALSQLESGG